VIASKFASFATADTAAFRAKAEAAETDCLRLEFSLQAFFFQSL
jgi:hypothetical protein